MTYRALKEFEKYCKETDAPFTFEELAKWRKKQCEKSVTE